MIHFNPSRAQKNIWYGALQSVQAHTECKERDVRMLDWCFACPYSLTRQGNLWQIHHRSMHASARGLNAGDVSRLGGGAEVSILSSARAGDQLMIPGGLFDL